MWVRLLRSLRIASDHKGSFKQPKYRETYSQTNFVSFEEGAKPQDAFSQREASKCGIGRVLLAGHFVILSVLAYQSCPCSRPDRGMSAECASPFLNFPSPWSFASKLNMESTEGNCFCVKYINTNKFGIRDTVTQSLVALTLN